MEIYFVPVQFYKLEILAYVFAYIKVDCITRILPAWFSDNDLITSFLPNLLTQLFCCRAILSSNLVDG